MNQHIYWISAVATDIVAGNALAALIGAEPGDASAFDRGTKCYPSGTLFSLVGVPPMTHYEANNPVSAYYVGVCAKQEAYDIAAEYAGNGPYPRLNALGTTDAQVAWFKERVFVQTGTRAAVENNWSLFITSLGYCVP